MATIQNNRNIQDATYVITRALPTADGTVTSADIDLGADVHKTENVELEITIPALNATQLPDADTLTVTVQAGAAVTPTADLFGLPLITGSTGYAGNAFRFRLPSDCPRYLNVTAVAAGGTGDISGADMTIKLLF
jgi:hypothetical protein